jgi:hypothetical protein
MSRPVAAANESRMRDSFHRAETCPHQIINRIWPRSGKSLVESNVITVSACRT